MRERTHVHIHPTCFGMKYTPVIIRKKNRIREEEDRESEGRRERNLYPSLFGPRCVMIDMLLFKDMKTPCCYMYDNSRRFHWSLTTPQFALWKPGTIPFSYRYKKKKKSFTPLIKHKLMPYTHVWTFHLKNKGSAIAGCRAEYLFLTSVAWRGKRCVYEQVVAGWGRVLVVVVVVFGDGGGGGGGVGGCSARESLIYRRRRCACCADAVEARDATRSVCQTN